MSVSDPLYLFIAGSFLTAIFLTSWLTRRRRRWGWWLCLTLWGVAGGLTLVSEVVGGWRGMYYAALVIGMAGPAALGGLLGVIGTSLLAPRAPQA